MPTRCPSSQSVSRLASASSARTPSSPMSWRRTTETTPSSSWTQQPTILPVPPGGGAGVAVAVEQVRHVLLVEVEPALLPAHHRGVEHRQQCGPGFRLGYVVQVVGEQVSHPVAKADLHGAELPQRAAYDALGRPQPPDEVSLGARPEGAQPALDQDPITVCRLGVSHRLTEPVLGQLPAWSRDVPTAVVRPTHDLPTDSERAQQPRGDREAAAVLLAGGELQP